MKKLDNKNKLQYETKKCMKKRIKNSKIITNVKEIDDEGLIHLKSGEVATLIEVKAIDLSLTSNQEKTLFFTMLKVLYQIPNLNMKCYKLDEKLNLNANKVSLEKKIEHFINDENKKVLLEESRNLIDNLEEKNFTVSSKYFWVLIAKDTAHLNKQLDEIDDITLNIVPRIYIESITNKLEIYKFLSNLYFSSNTLDSLMKNKEAIVSRNDLMDYLGSSDIFVDENTLSVNIARLRKKLTAIGAKNAIETKRGIGYILI